MKAISTKFIPCTNTRGARVKATDGDSSVTVSYEHASNDPHVDAALALCRKLNWHTGIGSFNEMVRGHTKEGCVFVWLDSDAILSADGTKRPLIRS